MIRDEDDLERCTNYIHGNPVKHGLARRAKDYPWSSFSQFVASGDYDPDWGGELELPDVAGAEWE
jgi:putative transposase